MNLIRGGSKYKFIFCELHIIHGYGKAAWAILPRPVKDPSLQIPQSYKESPFLQLFQEPKLQEQHRWANLWVCLQLPLLFLLNAWIRASICSISFPLKRSHQPCNLIVPSACTVTLEHVGGLVHTPRQVAIQSCCLHLGDVLVLPFNTGVGTYLA